MKNLKKQLSNHVLVLCTVIFSLNLHAAPQRVIEVQGHRGERGLLSENSLPAFEAAVRQGVDTLEMDLAITKDMQLVISHDPRINFMICVGPDKKPILEGQAPFIHDLTLEQVKTYDCGSIQHPKFSTQKTTSTPGAITRIPTLDEVFDMVTNVEKTFPHKRPVHFNIETKEFRDIAKDDHPVTPSEFARLWYDKVNQRGMLRRSIFQSFDPRTLVAVKGIDKTVVTAWLTEDPEEDLVVSAKAYGVNIVSPYWIMKNVNKDSVAKLHKMKVQVVPWTANTEEAWDKLVTIGADAIISDNPVALMAYLKSKNIKTLTESNSKTN